MAKFTSKKEIEIRYNRKKWQLERWYKNELQKFDNGENIRKIAKPSNTSKSVREKAFEVFQKCMRLLRADDQWYVLLMDTKQKVLRTECDGWHYFPKHNYPSIAFDEDNCRPISKRWNKQQWDQEWLLWKDNLIEEIGIRSFERLEEKKLKDKWIKRDRKYYEQQLEKRSLVLKKEMERRGI